jgi:cytochrome c oxidase subunit 4
MAEKEQLVFFNGQPVENAHENHHHVSPMWMYIATFTALLILTAITYAVSFANLGPMSLLVAMVVAAIKASLVIAFFMHLAFEDRFYLFVFVSGIIGIFIFFLFVLFDIAASGDMNNDMRLGVPRMEADTAAHETDPEPLKLPPRSRPHLFQ